MTEATAHIRRSRFEAHPQWWLGTMLLALHFALAWGIEGLFAHALLLVHFGLFLIWQPVWRGERSLAPRQTAYVVLIVLALATWNDWWLMAIWLAALVALLGGALLGSRARRQRLVALLAAIYLLSLLLVWVVPHLFADQTFARPVVLLVQHGLILLPIAVMLIPGLTRPKSSPLSVDLVYSTVLFLLVMGLVLGSFVVKQVSHGDYPLALAQSLIGMALLFIGLSWMWNPRGGFIGIGDTLSRYLMGISLPFERWVQNLAALAEGEREPERFLSLALRDLADLPWIVGIAWHARDSTGAVGGASPHHVDYSFQDMKLIFYTRWALRPALLLHVKLLSEMLGHFYAAKQREEARRNNAYTEAIYETGARLTHDVKNLLQSLRGLCAAAESSGSDEAAALQSLIKGQLPQIAQRLSTTLEKLTVPQIEDSAKVDARLWWANLRRRYSQGEIVFIEGDDAHSTHRVPAELFDSVAENLLQNAITKLQQQENGRITVRFEPAALKLTVCDTGSAIPRHIASRLFHSPVQSDIGLGIGLYHAAKQAQQLGYQLKLTANEEGHVCFELGPEPNA